MALESEGISCWIAPRDVKGGRALLRAEAAAVLGPPGYYPGGSSGHRSGNRRESFQN
jgi:hypothetical protein